MILTVFQDPMANLWFHLLFIAVVMIIYRELVHYHERLRQMEDLKKLNARWAEAFELQRERYQASFRDELSSPRDSKNVVWVDFQEKKRARSL